MDFTGMSLAQLLEECHSARTMKITRLYPIEVDSARKVPRIETSAVRAGVQFSLYKAATSLPNTSYTASELHGQMVHPGTRGRCERRQGLPSP